MASTGPQQATSPLEVLSPERAREVPILSKYWNPAVAGVVGFTAVVMTNWALKRPLFSGIQKHIFATVLGVGIGKVVDDYRNDYFAERDAAFRHYIQLHPEDFPDFNRQKFADVLERWVPIR